MRCQASVGSVGSSYDNAMAETINGLHKTELRRFGAWNTVKDVERLTFEWVYWYNHQRLFSKLRYVPPVEFEANYYQHQVGLKKAA